MLSQNLFPIRKPLFLAGLLMLVLLNGCAGSRFNEAVIPPMEEVEAMLAFVGEDLQLSDEQLKKLRVIVMENVQIKRNIHKQYRNRPLEMREATDARLDKFERQFGAVLTPEQRKLFPSLMRAIQRSELKDSPDSSTMRTPGDPGFDGTRGY